MKEIEWPKVIHLMWATIEAEEKFMELKSVTRLFIFYVGKFLLVFILSVSRSLPVVFSFENRTIGLLVMYQLI